MPSGHICGCCAEQPSIKDMSEKDYYLDHDILKPLFPGVLIENRDYIVDNVRILLNSNDGGDIIYLCKSCERCLKRRKVPVKALRNSLDFGEVPEELQGLNMQEERMIGVINCVTSIIKLGNYAGGQYGLKGGIAHLINDLPTQVNVKH